MRTRAGLAGSFGKQHYLADVAGGLVLAVATPAVFRRWGPGKEGR